jgi:antitoxin MazE
METTVAKWGNSIAIRIPSAFANGLRIKEGTPVIIEVENGMIVIKRKKYSFDELALKITPENRHEETDWGSPVGKEIW